MRFNFQVLNKYRIKEGKYASDPEDTYGVFLIPFRSFKLKVLATDGKGFSPQWEHVSVSLPNRCPNWEEMSFIKDLFWSEEEAVIQIHPPKSEYINNHPHCLHLWRSVDSEQPLPPSIMVGLKKGEKK